MFILYNKHIHKHYPIYLIMMTDVAVVEERISHNTFKCSLIILLQKVLIVRYEHNQQFYMKIILYTGKTKNDFDVTFVSALLSPNQ